MIVTYVTFPELQLIPNSRKSKSKFNGRETRSRRTHRVKERLVSLAQTFAENLVVVTEKNESIELYAIFSDPLKSILGLASQSLVLAPTGIESWALTEIFFLQAAAESCTFTFFFSLRATPRGLR